MIRHLAKYENPKWIIYTFVLLVTTSCTGNSKSSEVETSSEKQELPRLDFLNSNKVDVGQIRWNGHDSHFRSVDDNSYAQKVIERAVYVDLDSYDVEDLLERIEELEDEVEELHRKLDDIEEYTSSAKNSLEDALYFHLPGSFDDVERCLREIEWECMY